VTDAQEETKGVTEERWTVTRRPCDRCGKATLYALCSDCEERDYHEGHAAP
jgi:hypothetical protein